MSFYVSAYDTEAVYPWWESGFRGFDYSSGRVQEFLAGVEAVANVHLEREVPATFFLVAKMLEFAGPELRRLFDDPLFEVQSHSFTHANLIALDERNDSATLRYELADSKKLIEDSFGHPVLGLTAPGGFTHGFVGHPRLLEIMWDAGYRYVRSVGAGPQGTVPAPLNLPFWYTQDGFPDLLETPSHAWHDNILTGQPGSVHWPPVLPWGYPTAMPHDAHGVFDSYAPGIDYCTTRDILYFLPIFHPWSIYRIDQQAHQIALLLDLARSKMRFASCHQIYQHIVSCRTLATDEMVSA